jgi:ribosomal protein S1
VFKNNFKFFVFIRVIFYYGTLIAPDIGGGVNIFVVKTKKDYGLFITIEEGVTGLLHVSEVGEDIMDVFSNGDKITVQIIRIDVDAMKVFLKMPQ